MQNRVIKFRAWNVATRVMVDLKKITPLALNIDTNGLFIPFSDGLPLMQYTGLKDKNGKEIYEGDIIKTTTGLIYEVFWCEEMFSFRVSNKTSPANGYMLSSAELDEVIGNIYEHAELFK